MSLAVLAESSGSRENFASFDVPIWIWFAFLALISVLLIVDLLLVHRTPHAPTTKEAAIESAVWISIGVAFTGRDLRLAWRAGRRRVHIRLPDREEPQRRQRLRLGADHELLRGAPRVPVPGAVLGRLRRARAAIRLHLRRGRAARAVRVAAIRVRRVPAGHRVPHVAPRRRGGGPPRAEPGPPIGAARHTVDHRIQRPAPVRRSTGASCSPRPCWQC